MTFTRDQWARAFLAGIGNNNPSSNTVNWVINWTAAEDNSTGVASFNLLNTTQTMPGSYGGGVQGNIQNFTSFSQGVEANDITIKNGLYNNLLQALKTNNESDLGFGGVPSSGVMSDLSMWCGGCGYGNWFATQQPSQNILSQQYNGTVDTQIPNISPSSDGITLPGIQWPQLFQFLGLPSQSGLVTFFQQFMLVSIGIIVVMVGIMILFFSSDTGKTVIRTGEEAAIAS